MQNIFHESFSTETDNIPGGWYVEQNSNLDNVPAIRCGENCIELLSAGNKFLPIIPDVENCTVNFRLSVNFTMTKNDVDGGFAFLIFFHYDLKKGQGQAVRISRNNSKECMVFEYGTVRRNRFTPSCAVESPVMDEEILNAPFDGKVVINRNKLHVECAGESADFEIQSGKGKIAIAREHFFDILKLLAFDIESDDELAFNEKKFTIPLPDEHTYYPIFCDIIMRDYGSCMAVEASFRGGVRDTKLGEGNYSSLRLDMLHSPFVKVITGSKVATHVLYNDEMWMVSHEYNSGFVYKYMYKKHEWPFVRTAVFLKPEEDFNLAIGFKSYNHAPNADLAQSPSETIFDLDGNVLYSGLGLTDGKIKFEFLSQADKKIISKLPTSDPRYDRAVQFAISNHYFFEDEIPEFKIRLTGKDFLPSDFKIVLEDVFFRFQKELKYTVENSTFTFGLTKCNVVTLNVESVGKLPCGVWHLRADCTDPCFDLHDYCAFEIMSEDENAPVPAIISNLPYIYNSRTETRGLMTDGFDPWIGKSVNSCHYIACSNFLGPAARKYDMIPTVKAYQREYFLWLSDRCLNAPLLKDNQDLVDQSDYVNMAFELKQSSLLWQYSYCFFVLEKLIEFVKSLNDSNFDIAYLENLLKLQHEHSDWKKRGEFIDHKTFAYLTGNYWEEWLDFINDAAAERNRKLIDQLRKTNPKIKFAQYGPAHIYAACLKGPEFVRLLQCGKSDVDYDGFWQYEDYPFSCRYGLERGSYFLASCLLALPGSRIYPEVYIGGGKGGCTDGAVYYAHPPFGGGNPSRPSRMFQLAFEYRYATSHFTEDGFKFWEKCGFQACRFNRPWFESLLNVWRIIDEHPPVRPVKGAFYVFSAESVRQARDSQMLVKYPEYNIIDVRNSASEDVPFISAACRRQGQIPGTIIMEETVLKLTEKDLTVLVLPPLKGVSEKVLAHIRKLHASGVALLGNEDVTGLEDLFGVRNTKVRKNISEVIPAEGFISGKEFCDDERCMGSYEVTDAEILLNSDIPVLTIKDNGSAKAAFFNVAPHMVREDQLILRMTYGKDNISKFMEKAVAEVMKLLAAPSVSVKNGKVIACHTVHDELIVLVYNHDDLKAADIEVSVDPALIMNREISCNTNFSVIAQGKYRLHLEADGNAVIIFK
ncbi:MAG: hypothetical protein IKB71_09320 [Lentisphaeria bacterium]|nr:hypothetical protein [Lentisphaeria bacterium]